MISLEELTIDQQIGQLVVVGFRGTRPQDPGVQHILNLIKAGQISGVALFRYNIVDAEQVKLLIETLQSAASKIPLFISIDQEGGKVQRLNAENGFSHTPSAKEVALTCDEGTATRCYSDLGEMLQKVGCNLDFAPCVDLASIVPEESSPVIGGIERSYSSCPGEVVSFAGCMVDGLRSHGVLSCLKHFPGHGRARGDTHAGLVDITDTWSEQELEPYATLLQKGKVDMIMSAHLSHQSIDEGLPATLSAGWMKKLREGLSYDGVVVSDCLHMGAVIVNYTLDEVVTKAINAGVDILLFSNNPLAASAQGIRYASDTHNDAVAVNEWIVPDPDLPIKVAAAINQAIHAGHITRDRIAQACKRVLDIKNRL